MGREDDRKRREDLCRRDNAERCEKVDEARKNLYNKGYAITGDHVDGLLKGKSMVPTLVRTHLFVLLALGAQRPPFRMPSQLSSPNLVLIIIRW